MKVLHLASFCGNYGDILNHQGFYNTIGKTLHFDKITQKEVRLFYRNVLPQDRLFFNEELAKEINTHDLFVLGGGGFFDAKWSYSSTGTTMDLNESFINSIKVPTVINAMGYHEFFNETNPLIIEKFRDFLDRIIDKGWFVSLRNDGSLKRLKNRFGDRYNGHIFSVPDNGFFGTEKFIHNNCLSFYSCDEKTIGLCITNDLFTREFNKNLDTNAFNKIVIGLIEELAHSYRIVLFAHTPDDVTLIGDIFRHINDNVKRKKISICPFCPNNGKHSIAF